jgi:hypothetical protein
MPPRKSDSSRKSDANTARFVPVSEEPEASPPAGSATSAQAQAQAQAQGGEKKGQPGGSESKDTVSIDVSWIPLPTIAAAAY